MLRLKDVHVLGCSFTLYPVAKKHSVDEKLICKILISIYHQLQCHIVSPTEKEFPETLTCSELTSEEIKKAIKDDLLKKDKKGYHLAKTALEIFEEAAKKQEEIEKDAFFGYSKYY